MLGQLSHNDLILMVELKSSSLARRRASLAAWTVLAPLPMRDLWGCLLLCWCGSNFKSFLQSENLTSSVLDLLVCLFLFCPQVKRVFWEGGGLLGSQNSKNIICAMSFRCFWEFFFFVWIRFVRLSTQLEQLCDAVSCVSGSLPPPDTSGGPGETLV